MYTTDQINLPKSLLDVAISLDSIGLDSFAFSLEDTLKVIKLLEEDYPDIIILGGDILVYGEKKVECFFACWDYEIEKTKNITTTASESRKRARDYLQQFDSHPEKEKILIDMIIGDLESLQEASRLLHERTYYREKFDPFKKRSIY